MSKAWPIAALLALLVACQATPEAASPGTSSVAPQAPLPHTLTDELAQSPVLGLQFWVNGTRSPMRAETGQNAVQTQIGTGEFEIRFPKRKSDLALRMIAWTDRTIFALRPGQQFDDVQFLQPGTGMADERSGRMTLFLDPAAQNYYVGERVQEHDDDQEKVQFLGVQERNDLKAAAVFVVAIIDFDGDEVVDQGEYEYFDVRLVRTEA
ncbi:hypothetical protein ACFYOT_34645 [Saccharothrix saharensis]|uniref:hypothetical protein n=1 Tax=Saccharothrix saharensis TaxID=571190 RepID=UPI0036B94E9F